MGKFFRNEKPSDDNEPDPYKSRCSECDIVRRFVGKTVPGRPRYRMCGQCDMNQPHERWVIEKRARERHAEDMRNWGEGEE